MIPSRVPSIPTVPRIDTQFTHPHPSHQTAPPHPQPTQRDESQTWSSYELLPPNLGMDDIYSFRHGSPRTDRVRPISGSTVNRAMSMPALPAELAIATPHVGLQSPQPILGMSPLMASPDLMSEQEASFFSRPGTAG